MKFTKAGILYMANVGRVRCHYRTACRIAVTSRRAGRSRPAHLAERTWLRQPSKEFVVECIERGEMPRSPSQKLPSTAIYCHFGAAKRLSPMQPFHSLLGFGDMPGRRAEKRERRQRSLGGIVSSSLIPSKGARRGLVPPVPGC